MKLPSGWVSDSVVDLRSTDGWFIVELKSSASGLRDLYAGLLELALAMRESPKVRGGLLAMHLAKARVSAVEEAWRKAIGVLEPKLAARVSGLIVASDGRWTNAPPVFRELAEVIAEEFEHGREARPPIRSGLGAPFFDVAKVLLEAWLRRRGPLRIQTLANRVGCSAPTVAGALRELDARGEIVRSSDRRVELRGVPRRTLDELIVRADRLRSTRWFVDRSGRADPEALLRRLRRAKLAEVEDTAIGGVVAARWYDPSFDLQGLPRIDLTVRSTTKLDASVLVRLDPAIVETHSPRAEAIAAVHTLTRAERLFEPADSGLPYADPVEVFLDLQELHLGAQAEDFLNRVRRSAS